MDIVIDANVLAGYFVHSVIGKMSELTIDPTPIFASLGVAWFVAIDEDGQIENEWRNVVEREWFDAWLPTLYEAGAIREVAAAKIPNVLRKLRTMGMPSTRDRWYVRTAATISDENSSNAIIVTEDMDFYDPSKKSESKKTRDKVLLSGNGKVSNYLRSVGVDPQSVSVFLG